MKRVLVYYSFGFPLGGGDLLPLSFAVELQEFCHLTLAVDSAEGLERACKAFGLEPDRSKTEIAVLMPPGYRSGRHNALLAFRRSRRLKALARDADVCISAGNVIDFGKPAHHFINYLAGVDRALCGGPASGPRVGPTWTGRLRKAVENRVVRPVVGMRAKSAIIRDGRECVYPNSVYVRERMQRAFGEFSGELFYPPTLFEPEGADGERDPLRVVCLGRINADKRLDAIVDIVERARTLSGKDLKLAIAGPYDPNAEYAKKLLKALESRPWASLSNGAFGRQKSVFLQSGTFAVHARRDEEFGIAITEYMKAGLIPVVPDQGGSGEVVGNPDLTYATNEDAARILARLLADGAFREEQRRKCAGRATVFSRDAYLARQRELLHRIVGA